MVYIKGTADLCEMLLRKPIYHATPLQRKEFRQLVEANGRGNQDEVEQLTKQIEHHFTQLNKTFGIFIGTQVNRDEVALCMIFAIYNDYTAPEAKRSISRAFILAYGDPEQQDLALTKKVFLDSRESLRLWRTAIEETEFQELCLDYDYATKRLQAACSGTNLVNELVARCEWDALMTLLHQDLQTCLDLTFWLIQAGRCFEPFWEEAYGLVSTQIKRYRAIADNRPDSADPPPAYSVNDPMTTAPPPPPATLMNVTGLDILLNWVRQT